MTDIRDLWRLGNLQVEEALIHMLAVTGIILLVFLLAAILVKCRLYLTLPKVVDQHKGIKVREAIFKKKKTF